MGRFSFKNLKKSKRKRKKYIRKYGSRGEIEVARVLKQLKIEYLREHKFPWLKGIKGGQMRLDFYLPFYNTAIEYDGIYHSKPVQKLNDSKKDLLLKEHNISLL